MYSLWFVQWDFTRRDHPGDPGRVSGSGPVMASLNAIDKGLPRLYCVPWQFVLPSHGFVLVILMIFFLHRIRKEVWLIIIGSFMGFMVL